ncbi:MAG TPA: dTDP-4-amino-4,6-dideoxygalactose transaminase [Bacteroidales bacterium]|nr:MAG: dTDP-4-amino-4,6-dideoxygalactose transaminase [Bacteroidetes bacterium ADurb.Bin012]HNQ59893.1 dTDP-4-amino-4,6-dideoxygalactose transaminase [Bacteroidales bacterium]HNU22294.1 dTDP-4-amino-4,6-dideoxygalactose transaminase [Bacteroidales bacterium]HNV17048.1 dTDP-4-amino-4,6-dideoxygalactose transaminase [Bacteroidales bacterium]HNZ80042.1 dTDP-4-amino-4,6-dideoxygalactose transaminase [Bacteroidales bacterium]
MHIPFNKPYFGPREAFATLGVALSGQFSGNGKYTQRCQTFFEKRFHFAKTLLTTSCSDALEMAAILSEVGPGDEVIMPSFTFPSTANAFLLRGAKIVFADTLPDIPNIDPKAIENLITPKTRAIVVVHYCGISCDMEAIQQLANKYGLLLIEDAAHSIDSYYKGKPLGSFGHLAAFSFHETKNIISGEGGLLVVNDEQFTKRAEIIWEKGTNRAAFQRKEVNRYEWVDIGSSFLPAEMVAAFLYAQLSKFDRIQKLRKKVWLSYYEYLKPLEEKGFLQLPIVPEYASVNGNFFYIAVKDGYTRDELLRYLQSRGIHAVFHYLPLHQSPFFTFRHDGRALPHTEKFSSTIIRLPFYPRLSKRKIKFVCNAISSFFESPQAYPVMVDHQMK